MKVVVLFLIVTFYLSQADICLEDQECPPVDGITRLCRKKIGDETGECVFGCLFDSECPLPRSVDPTTNSEKKICNQGICVAGCRTDNIFGESEDCLSEDKPRCNSNFHVEGTDVGQCDAECRSNEDCRLAGAESTDPEEQALILLHTFCLRQTGKSFSGCSVCRTNADCVDFAAPICSEGECVACTKDADCRVHPTGKVCRLAPEVTVDPTSLICGCNTDADCTGKQLGNICNEAGICSCIEDTDCKVKGFGKCSDNVLETVKICGNCKEDGDCLLKSGPAICYKAELVSKCILADCSSSPLGTRIMGQDLCGCRDDDDCENTKNNPFTPACDCAASKCVACTRDIHCKSFERCNDAKKCVPLKCQSDFDCFRKDLIELGKERTEEARCSDALICVAKAPACVDSIVTLFGAKATASRMNYKAFKKFIPKQ